MDTGIHSVSRYEYYRYINQKTSTTLTHIHTTTTFSDPLSADFTNTHAHERSLREVNFNLVISQWGLEVCKVHVK